MQINIGILEVGKNNEKTDKRRPHYANMIMTLLQTENGGVTFTPIAVKDGIFPSSVSTYEGYLVTISASGVYDDIRWLIPLTSLIVEAYEQQTQQMGICFGHHLLAHALVGWVEKSEKGWRTGIGAANVTAPTNWMRGAGETLNLIFFHQDKVVRLANSAHRIAGNTFCPNAGFSIDTKIFSLRGHPKFPVDYAEELLSILAPKVVKERACDALATLNRPTENPLVANWIRRFSLQQTNSYLCQHIAYIKGISVKS